MVAEPTDTVRPYVVDTLGGYIIGPDQKSHWASPSNTASNTSNVPSWEKSIRDSD